MYGMLAFRKGSILFVMPQQTDCCTAQAVREAIGQGIIYWHALPFNAQPEMFDAHLLEAAVQLTHDLDDAFSLDRKVTVSQVGLCASELPTAALDLCICFTHTLCAIDRVSISSNRHDAVRMAHLLHRGWCLVNEHLPCNGCCAEALFKRREQLLAGGNHSFVLQVLR